jgi:hypothetical protein
MGAIVEGQGSVALVNSNTEAESSDDGSDVLATDWRFHDGLQTGINYLRVISLDPPDELAT